MITTDLAPTLSTDEAAGLLGCSTATLWKLVKRGEAPVEPLHLGRKLRWPTSKVLEVLGLDEGVHPRNDRVASHDAPAPERGDADPSKVGATNTIPQATEAEGPPDDRTSRPRAVNGSR